ncbi:TonB-dependent siderophore receptor [Rugamonas sp.]|uniref:TonB-dependent siderophore receptor n=1 Tax=Rugamonas sp. TaxID=1926287 RepID=UPI0025CC997A|nr:TonB-dependent siderophore receptor [Rugamonas sp.]
MPTPKFALSAVAVALLQAYAAHAAGAPSTPAAADAADQPLPEVIVSARAPGARAAVGGFADTPLMQTPASVSVLSAQQMQDRDIHSTTDAARYDASISDSYNAVGYAEQFSIRGFDLDPASSYRKDGMAISGDTQIPLENKERIEILKGLAGLEAGIAAPGGIVNYVTKRPTATPLRSVVFEERERGTLYGAIDLGGRFDDPAFGYRINAAAERLRSSIKGADGNRKFISGAFDWQISPQALLQLDADYQYKSQITAPGFQLIDGATLPKVDPDTLLNNQPWTKPVTTTSSNIGLRFEYTFTPQWKATFSANQHQFRRDDYTAFPEGCGDMDPGFCANGDYNVYDYISVGERKSPLTAQAMVQGQFATGALTHDVTGGYSFFRNREQWGDDFYTLAGLSNIYHPVVVAPPEGGSGPVTVRRTDHERALFAQDIVGLSSTVKLHLGARYTQVKRDEADALTQVDQGFWLPNAALVYSPTGGLSLYGSYAQGLEHGGIAPIGTNNEQDALNPSKSKQIEVGIKANITPELNLTAALYQIRKGLEYIDGDNNYVRNGQAQHRGIELGANGRVTRALEIGASAAALNTKQSGTGDGDIDGKRVTNVPAFKSTVYAEYALPQLEGVKLNANWQYASKKAFDVQNTVFVPGYHVLNLGGSYATRVGKTAATFRAYVDNALNRYYWRDVTPQLGGYLLPGATRTFRISAQFDL